MADYLTFANIQDEVGRAIKDYKDSKLDLVKMMINMVYLDELMVCDDLHPLYWMVDFDDALEAEAPVTITGITQATDGVFTTDGAHGHVAGNIITIHDVAGMTELNDRIYTITSVPLSTTFKVGVNTSGYTAYSSGGTINHRGLTLASTGKNVQQLLSATWQDKDPMTSIDYDDMEKDTDCHFNDRTRRPDLFYFGKGFSSAGAESNQIIWHPGSDANYRLRYWFEERASKMTADADVPILPPQFHPAIVSGVIMRLAEFNVQVENQVVWPGIYASQIEALKQFNRKYYENIDSKTNKKPYLL